MGDRLDRSRRRFVQGMVGLSVVGITGVAARGEISAVAPELIGPAEASNRFQAWGSFTCPFTAMLMTLLTRIAKANPDTVCIEWHHFPTHKPDPAIHVASLAFSGTAYWGYAQRIFDAILAASGDFRGLTREKLVEFAKAEGGSEEDLEAAYADRDNWDAVKADLIAGQLLGVKVTPGLFYRGYFLTPTGLPRNLKEFEKSMFAMLKQK